MQTPPRRATSALLVGAVVGFALGACQPATTTSSISQGPAVSAASAGAPPSTAEQGPYQGMTLAQAVARLQTADQYASGDFSYSDAEVTLREGLEGISERYIDPVNIDRLAVNGLKGLVAIDPALRLDLDAKRHLVSLKRDDALLAQLPVPRRHDAEGWARITTLLLMAGRNVSHDLQSADNERIFEAVFDGMLANLDKFSCYAGADEARANRARRDGFGGIGIRFTRADGGILVTHVMEGSPAMDAGLKPGDVILKVNGHTTTEHPLKDVAKYLRGPVGSLLTVNVTRLDSDPTRPERHIAFNLKRAHIVPETVRAHAQDGVLVLNVSSFNKNTSTSMHDILREHHPAMRSGLVNGIVMDLRGNPGGLLSQSVNVADLFLDDGRIIATRGRHPDSDHDYTAGGIDLGLGLPLVILLDGDSASAAEIVASALQDSGRAVVVGSASYGKGTVQTVLRLPNDGEVTLTWSRFVSPSGYAIQDLGVMPAVCATNTASEASDVESLTRAILAPEHIDGGRDTMDAWRAAGMIFDGRRRDLRNACPARTLEARANGDLLMQLARRVIDDPGLYTRAVMLSKPVNTARR